MLCLVSWWVSVLLIGLPTFGALTAWGVGLRAWRAARSRAPRGPQGRDVRGRTIPLMVLPTTLILFALVILFLLLGEAIPDAEALPAVLSCGVPGLLSGMALAIVNRRGIAAAAASNRGFGHVMLLAVQPVTPSVFGLLVSFFLIGVGSNAGGILPFPAGTAWTASAFSMIGGVGGLVSAWLAASFWDFETEETWPKALARSGLGEFVTVACLAFAMAILGEWLMELLVLYFVCILAVGLMRSRRGRRSAPRSMKPS